MKSFANILLATLILFQGMFSYVDISFQLEELLQDYKIHQVKYGDDLQTFISKHFGDLREQHQEQHKKEHQEHHHHDINDVNLHVDYVCFKNYIKVPKKDTIFFKTDNFRYKNLFSTFEKQKIFQPPRV